jgi:hypothetical protein
LRNFGENIGFLGNLVEFEDFFIFMGFLEFWRFRSCGLLWIFEDFLGVFGNITKILKNFWIIENVGIYRNFRIFPEYSDFFCSNSSHYQPLRVFFFEIWHKPCFKTQYNLKNNNWSHNERYNKKIFSQKYPLKSTHYFFKNLYLKNILTRISNIYFFTLQHFFSLI